MNLDLFNASEDPERNLLPYDGTVNYFGRVFDLAIADTYYDKLLANIRWKSDEAVMFGKRIVTKRKVSWYGDKPYDYTYSNITKKALPWTKVLLDIKEVIELNTSESYNSCLLNLYHDGSEGMAWHSDGEKTLKEDGAIASVSFGALRKFSFKHKESKEKMDVFLEHGSLLVMSGSTQRYWLHRLPPTRKVLRPRINLTFRTIVEAK